MEVLSKKSLREFLAFLQETPFENALSMTDGTAPNIQVTVVVQEYERNPYIEETSLLDGVPRTSVRNITGMIRSILSYVTCGSGNYVGMVDVYTRTRSIFDVLNSRFINVNTAGLNYVALVGAMSVNKMSVEQRKRMMICIKLIAEKDNNLDAYNVFVANNPFLRICEVKFNVHDHKNIVSVPDDLSILVLPGPSRFQGIERLMIHNGVRSVNREYGGFRTLRNGQGAKLQITDLQDAYRDALNPIGGGRPPIII